MAKRRCFICLKPNHTAGECRTKDVCPKCSGKHHVAICVTSGREDASMANPGVEDDGSTTIVTTGEMEGTEESSKKDVDKTQEITSNIVSIKQCVLLQTAKATVFSSKDQSKTTARLIFDNCAQQSYIKESLSKLLKLPKIGEKKVAMKAFGARKSEIRLVDIVRVNVRTRDNPSKHVSVSVLVVPLICLPVSNQIIDNVKERYPVLAEVELADDNSTSTDMEIDILIGANHLCKFVSTETIQVTSCLRAIRTNLGWVLNGSIDSDEQGHSVSVTPIHTLHLQTESVNELHSQFQKFWEIEDCEATEERFNPVEFKKQIEFDGDRYNVPLPFLPGTKKTLPLNYGLCKKRLSSMLTKLERDPEKLEVYNAIIQKQEAENKIERVTSFPPQGEAHYLAHHPVEKPNRETTKTRVVYDASAGNPSLNDCLDKGENLVPLMYDVLIRSRFYKVALTGDIREAFLNVGLQEEFRDFVRFLWYDDVCSPN